MEIFDYKTFYFDMVLKCIFDSFHLFYLKMTLNTSMHYFLQQAGIVSDKPVICFLISKEIKKNVEVFHSYKLKNYFELLVESFLYSNTFANYFLF